VLLYFGIASFLVYAATTVYILLISTYDFKNRIRGKLVSSTSQRPSATFNR